MERSEIRDSAATNSPDCAALHPGYARLIGCGPYAITSRCLARSSSATMMVMLSAFQPRPFMKAAA